MLEAKNLIKTFKNGEEETRVLKGVSLQIKKGEWVAIMGRSGAGKSTLMYQLSLLDEPSGGDVIVEGKSTKEMSYQEEIAFRLRNFGYVFQDYALLPELTALENTALPLLMQGMERKDAEGRATEVLSWVNLSSRLSNLPGQLSGGEQQRVSIARAMGNRPKILFADEPTANLDNLSARSVMEVFKRLHADGQTIIMVTHESEYSKLANRVVKLDDGLVVEIINN